MLDATGKTKTVSQTVAEGPPADFQAHPRALDARGLVTRVDRPIDKDRELNPLVRWQFQGGLREDGLDALGGSPDDFRRFIRSETERWARVIRDMEAAKGHKDGAPADRRALTNFPGARPPRRP